MNKDFKILLAEDNPGHAKLLTRHLKRNNIDNDIILFENGIDILTYVDLHIKSKTDCDNYLLILDIRMPGYDGIEVLRGLKERLLIDDLTVIMFTTTETQDEVETCYELGCNLYLNKAIAHDEFQEKMTQLKNYLERII